MYVKAFGRKNVTVSIYLLLCTQDANVLEKKVLYSTMKFEI
jgi:hypothetical protein